ncbi:MAG: flagellar export chaperone FliS [Holophaga sp.]|nr:flagellar export chaperone FliS [Holophaga sp.]
MDGQQRHQEPDQELARRIQKATPEQMAAILLEGAQYFLSPALQAVQTQDKAAHSHNYDRVLESIFELRRQLNQEQGGELVANLSRMYDWWVSELNQGSMDLEPERLRTVFAQMGVMKTTWEELHHKKYPM